MIYILHDTLECYHFIPRRLTHPCRSYYSPQKKYKYLTWIAGAWGVVRKSQANDTIVAVYDFEGILCLIFSYLLFRRRRIIALNLLLKDKPTLKNKIASRIYKWAILRKEFVATVTSEAYGQWLNRKLGLDGKKHPLLRDVYYDSYEPRVPSPKGDGSVFCGGRSSRNWDLMIRLAESMPDVKFRFVLSKQDFSKIQHLQNVDAQCDIPMDRFLDLMSQSSVLCLPLTTESPAGLITFFQAAGLKKPIISSKTVTTKEYLTPERGTLLSSDNPADWEKAIREILNDPQEAQAKADAFHKFVTTECSEEYFTNRIDEIIEETTSND